MPNTTQELETFECADCNATIQSDIDRYENCEAERICESCNHDYYACDSCSDQIHREDTQFHNDCCYCYSCFEEYYSSCDECGSSFHNDDLNRASNTSNDTILVCDSCRDDDYCYCDGCDRNVHSSMYDCDDDRCERCIGGSSGIKSYGYKPRPKFFKVSDNDNTYLGLELEVECKPTSTKTHKDMVRAIDCEELYFKRDGSLDDGFEIVSHPMTISYIKQNKSKWSNMLHELRSSGYRSYDTSTCGMHIHISKNAFTTWHLYRFMKFFVDNSDFVTKISQRKVDNLDKWAALTDNPREGGKEYTQESLMYKAKKKRGNIKRYLAVNLQNDNSVEIRIFRGTLNDSSFFKNIEFVQALFDYTKSIAETDMSLKSFLSFIKDNNEYPYLRKFIADKNINPFLTSKSI